MENEQLATISFIGDDQQIIVEFADGQHIIPPQIVQSLGKEYFETFCAGLRNSNYGDFLTNWNKAEQKRQLNQFGAEFVANHFGQMF
jgi:hypothetical protein